MPKARILLPVSLLANLFLLGVIGAGYASLHAGGGMIEAGSMRLAGAELPRAERQAFRTALHQARRSVRASSDEANRAKANAADDIRRPVVDQTALLRDLDTARASDMAVRAAVERQAVSFIAALPIEERNKIAEVMLRRVSLNKTELKPKIP